MRTKNLTAETSGSLESDKACGAILLDRSQIANGERTLSFFNYEIREAIYGTEDIFWGVAYAFRHNELMSAGQQGSFSEDDRLLVAITELSMPIAISGPKFSKLLVMIGGRF